MISTLVRLSRLPVGSSASSRAGLVDQRAGDGHALLLAAGELVRDGGPRGRARPTVSERLQGPLALLVAPADGARVEHRQLDVLQRRGARQQVEPLEDEADLLVADVGQLVAVRAATTSTPSSR